jgi:dUTP pyrophosphatase
MKLQIKRLQQDAKLPSFAHAADAGMDMYAVEEVTVRPHERVQVKTGIAIAIPEGYVGLIWDKSGISHKGGLKTLGGVVDAGYRGEVLVGVINLGDTTYTFKKGDKIAQMLIQKIECPELVVVEELDETERGAGGFGSTGA